MEPLEGIEIRAHRVAAERSSRVRFDCELVEAGRGADVASQRPQQGLHPHRIAGYAIDLANIGAGDVVEITRQSPDDVSHG